MVCDALLKSFVWHGAILCLSECVVVCNKYICVFARVRTLACATVMASRDRDRLKNLARAKKKKRQMSEWRKMC